MPNQFFFDFLQVKGMKRSETWSRITSKRLRSSGNVCKHSAPICQKFLKPLYMCNVCVFCGFQGKATREWGCKWKPPEEPVPCLHPLFILRSNLCYPQLPCTRKRCHRRHWNGKERPGETEEKGKEEKEEVSYWYWCLTMQLWNKKLRFPFYSWTKEGMSGIVLVCCMPQICGIQFLCFLTGIFYNLIYAWLSVFVTSSTSLTFSPTLCICLDGYISYRELKK